MRPSKDWAADKSLRMQHHLLCVLAVGVEALVFVAELTSGAAI